MTSTPGCNSFSQATIWAERARLTEYTPRMLESM